MGELQVAAESFPAWKAILWVFYPMATLVLVELISRTFNDDDDDDQDGGKGIRIGQLQPATLPSGA